MSLLEILDKDIQYDAIRKLYPTLTEQVRIHHWPHTNLIFGLNNAAQTRYVFETRTMTTINDDGAYMLGKCNGQLTAEEIITLISNERDVPVELIRDSISRFLIASNEVLGHVTLEEYPADMPRSYEITGTKKHITPVHFSLEITTRCNLRCQHCYRSSSPDIKEKEMSYEEIITILQKMHAIGARHIEVTGGELFLHQRIKDIMSYIGDHFDFIGILTNGTILPESMIKHLDSYKDKLIWSISLDSYLPDHHDKFRGMKGAYERTVKAIKSLTSRGHAVRVAMSVSEDNIGDVEETLLFVKDELKATWFGYNYILPYGRGKDMSWSIPQSEITDRYNEIDRFVDRYPGFTNKLSPEQVEEMRTRQINCGAGWRTLTIGSNGIVRPCVLMEENYLTMGNILDSEVAELMQQDTVNALLHLPWPLDKDCSGCSNESFCKYCAYRGFLINSERTQQGRGLCAWAEKNNIQDFIQFEQPEGDEDVAGSCYMKNCSMS